MQFLLNRINSNNSSNRQLGRVHTNELAMRSVNHLYNDSILIPVVGKALFFLCNGLKRHIATMDIFESISKICNHTLRLSVNAINLVPMGRKVDRVKMFMRVRDLIPTNLNAYYVSTLGAEDVPY